MKKILNTVIVLSSLGVFPLAASGAEDCLKIASDPKSVRAVKLFSSSVKKVFDGAGICADLITFPIRRIQASMQRGSIDGEFFRVNNYIKAMSNYVSPVPTPAIKANGLLITLASGDFHPKSLAEVGNKKIGILHGYKWHEILSKNFKHTSKSNKYVFLAKMLKAKRIHGILIEDFTLNRLFDAGILSKEEVYQSPAVIDLSVYILLNKKHDKLLARLDASIKKVIADGGFKLK